MNDSKQFSLNSADFVKLQNNFLIFVSPIIIMYLGSVSTLISQPGHLLTASDFVPNPILLGMIVKQLIDTTIDVFRKWSNGTPNA